MKILVVSDTHGSCNSLINAVKEKEFDMLFHLGDYVMDGEHIGKTLGIPSVIVRGNGDLDPKYKEEEIIEIKGKRILLTHGHTYNIRYGLNNLYYGALEVGADLVLFGHSHIAVNIVEKGIRIMNPGSPAFPRLNPRDPKNANERRFTYGIIDIEDEISTEIVEIE